VTIVKTLDDLCAWCEENICSKISLKLPNDENSAADSIYVHPHAFVLYPPAKDRLAPGVPAPIPSLCVQFTEGSDKLTGRTRRLKIQLSLSCWNPGLLSRDVLHPESDESALLGYRYYLDQAAVNVYTRNGDGWRDVWNFLDIALHIVENTEFFAGMRLVKEDGITYGPFTEEGAIWSYYPYWYSWIAFTLESGIAAGTPETYRDFL